MGPGGFQAGRKGGSGGSGQACRGRGEGSGGTGRAVQEARRETRGRVSVSLPFSVSQIAGEERQTGEQNICHVECHGLSPSH